jgi:hypothetical protein
MLFTPVKAGPGNFQMMAGRGQNPFLAIDNDDLNPGSPDIDSNVHGSSLGYGKVSQSEPGIALQ